MKSFLVDGLGNVCTLMVGDVITFDPAVKTISIDRPQTSKIYLKEYLADNGNDRMLYGMIHDVADFGILVTFISAVCGMDFKPVETAGRRPAFQLCDK